MQGDFVVPGSPLDDYIALLDQQGLLGGKMRVFFCVHFLSVFFCF